MSFSHDVALANKQKLNLCSDYNYKNYLWYLIMAAPPKVARNRTTKIFNKLFHHLSSPLIILTICVTFHLLITLVITF